MVRQRLAGNAAAVLGGNGLALSAQFAFSVVAARWLGPAAFGVLALGLAAEVFLDRLFNFQSWQGFIRFGAETVAQGRGQDLRRLAAWSYGLDGAASFAAFACGVGIMLIVRPWFPVVRDNVVIGLVVIGGVVPLATGTSIGALRLFDRYWTIALAQVAGAALRLAGGLWLTTRGGTVLAFAAVSIAGDVVTALILHASALPLLWRRAAALGHPERGAPPSFRQFFRFGIETNLSGTLRLAARECDLFVVGGFLGPAAAGVFKLAKQIGSIPLFVTDAAYQAVYPHFSRLLAAGERVRVRRQVRRAVLIVGTGVVVAVGLFALVGPWLIRVILGPKYPGVFLTTECYMVAVMIAAATFPFQPAMLADGAARAIFRIVAAATAAYFIILPLAFSAGGINGVALAYGGFYVVWAALTARELRRRELF